MFVVVIVGNFHHGGGISADREQHQEGNQPNHDGGRDCDPLLFLVGALCGLMRRRKRKGGEDEQEQRRRCRGKTVGNRHMSVVWGRCKVLLRWQG